MGDAGPVRAAAAIREARERAHVTALVRLDNLMAWATNGDRWAAQIAGRKG